MLFAASSSREKPPCISDVRRWLALEPLASCCSEVKQPLEEAVAVLCKKKASQEEVRAVASKWKVARRKNGNDRELPELREELVVRVIKRAQELQEKPLCISDVKSWLALEPFASCRSEEKQRIEEAVEVLSKRKLIRQEVRALLAPSKWNISRKENGDTRKDDDVRSELEGKVIQAAQALKKQLADSAGQLSGNADQAVVEGASSSAASSQLLEYLQENRRKRQAENEAQKQRPAAKVKAAMRQKKPMASSCSCILEMRDSQEQLADSAGQPSENADVAVVEGASSCAAEDSMGVVGHNERRLKRKADEVQVQGPAAKAKAARRQKKRSLSPVSHIFETPVSKRKSGCLSNEWFAANAKKNPEREQCDAASARWLFHAQQRSRRLCRVWNELKTLKSEGSGSEECKRASKEIEKLMEQAFMLSKSVLSRRELEETSMRELYKARCGGVRLGKRGERVSTERWYQDFSELTAQACAELDIRICDLVMRMDEVNENAEHMYPSLWEIKNRRHAAALNSLGEMPMRLNDFMRSLKDTRGDMTVPFGRLPTQQELKKIADMRPDLFVRRFACLELDEGVRFADLPDESRHAELIARISAHRSIERRIQAQSDEYAGEADITMNQFLGID